MTLRDRIGRIRERIAQAARRSGRDPAAIQLVAVTKTVPKERIAEAHRAGLVLFGENRVQEAAGKIPELPGTRWHLIGHLQRNKARRAVELFEMIQSLDSLRLAAALDRLGRARGRPVETLVEVNLAGEESKSGVEPERLPSLLDDLSGLEGIRVRGLMTVPPFESDPRRAGRWFRRLRELAERERAAKRPRIELRHLSMGMSHDFEVAIEEGATIVRIGTAIFGERPRP